MSDMPPHNAPIKPNDDNTPGHRNSFAASAGSFADASLTVASINVNGIRAAVKHRSEENLGFHEWLKNANVDVVLLQEVRASEKQAENALKPALDDGWSLTVAPAASRGRAGVGILSTFPVDDVEIGIPDFEDAGRWIEGTIHAGGGLDDVRLASLYLPSGGWNEKQDEKYAFLDSLAPVLQQRAEKYDKMLVAGDWNICHRREDLKSWKGNRKKAGFLPDERAFMDSIFGPGPGATVSEINDDTEAPRGVTLSDGRRQGNAGAIGEFFASKDYKPSAASLRGPAKDPKWIDVQRSFHENEEGPYSWYTWRGQAFDTGAGWRIDVHAATRSLADRAVAARTDVADTYDLRWSDHSPVVVGFK
ncbi:exodeoxyribonuclease III [Corynebacterium sp. MC-04]|uniref:Exodeoxyribonuclease III n=2 Tax=Corynebacterium TaxID=1716 RepID=A0ABS9HGG3_9CORY|nr:MULTISPECIES: exodeoxyribonuclease III [Corynebacterium]KXB50761.1 putative exodeoxyribonuclease III [Corynebacterium kroppenstedtii]MCF6769293.1 exodeoxyribonuclease III [Corynebacterium parakroppenstedtii]MCF6770847.1 exodeoxyribonuclease III [Corynebacterium parakroppenstedtii]MCF6772937.1 exodeoxyribonuclease III [Corynebacterium parakroppenstedtii]MCF6778706.1 exodeoxyribonuclease III [Corynebacterium parakroppenstedtii]